MRIDRIEKSKHKQERVLVFLEGGDLLRITGAELLRGRGMTPEDSRRLAAALQRRGFAWQEIRPVLNEWGQEIEET